MKYNVADYYQKFYLRLTILFPIAYTVTWLSQVVFGPYKGFFPLQLFLMTFPFLLNFAAKRWEWVMRHLHWFIFMIGFLVVLHAGFELWLNHYDAFYFGTFLYSMAIVGYCISNLKVLWYFFFYSLLVAVPVALGFPGDKLSVVLIVAVVGGINFLIVQDKLRMFRSLSEFMSLSDKAEKRNEHLRIFYEDIVENIPEGIIKYDSFGNITYINRSELSNEQLRRWAIGKTDLELCRAMGCDDEREKKRRNAMVAARFSPGEKISIVEELDGETYSRTYLSFRAPGSEEGLSVISMSRKWIANRKPMT